MKRLPIHSIGGFSLVELLVALTLSLLTMASVLQLFRQGVIASANSSQRTEMQQNARVALNLMAQDLSEAGTGFPQGGFLLPGGTGTTRPGRGCSSSSCGTWNYLSDDRLYAVIPGDELGPTIGGVATDIITVVYRDTSINISQVPLLSITPSGNQIQAQSGTSAAIASNDVLLLCNANGCAAGVVTGLGENDTILFANNDPLNYNQPSAAFGNIASLANPGPPSGVYPPTTAYRALVITYFIEASTLRLMRQVNAQPPVPVAEIVEDLQISYDTFNDVTLAATANLADAGNVPNQVRKINISIDVRSSTTNLHNGQYDRFNLKTSVSVRNLTFRDRYI